MGKVVTSILEIGAAIALVAVSGGLAGIGIAGIAGIAGTTLGTALVGAGVALALGGLESLISKTPSLSNAMASRGSLNQDTASPRKIIFGTTAAGADLRFREVYGNNSDREANVIALASHKLTSVDQISLGDVVVWANGAAVSNKYSDGIDSLHVVPLGSSNNGISVGTGKFWNSTSTFTGCAYLAITYRLDKSKVWTAGLPSIYVSVVKGCPVYDPRNDDTNGGSGSMRPDNQASWSFYDTDNATIIGDNPALCLLTYLIGWRMNNQLMWGMGIPANRINMASFILYANLCEEQVQDATGAAIRRYTCDAIFDTSQSHETIINSISLAMGSVILVDVDGWYGLIDGYDDTASTPVYLGPSDILSQTAYKDLALSESYNRVTGRFADPTQNYALSTWGSVSVDPFADGIERPINVDFGAVRRPGTCQRIAKQLLLRQKYSGTFSAVFGPRAFQVSVGSLVALTFPSHGWTNKLFRVIDQEEAFTLQFSMTLREESAEVYAWDKSEEKALPANIFTTSFDPVAAEAVTGLAIEARGVAGTNGVLSIFCDVAWTPATSLRTTSIEIEAQKSGTDDWTPEAVSFSPAAGSYTFPAGVNGQGITVRARYRMDNGAFGAWATASLPNTQPSNLNQWSSVWGQGKPQDGATRNVVQGDYSSSTAYYVGDLVNNQSAVWSCVANTTGNAPPTLPTRSNAWWTLFLDPAQAGDDSAALAEIDRIQSDKWLSRSEKPEIIRDVVAIQQEQPTIVQLAQQQGLSTTAYTSAYQTLINDLTGLSPGWSDTSQDTSLGSVNLSTDFSSYYSQKAALDLGTGRGVQQQLATIASDGVLSKGEKSAVLQDYNVIVAEFATLQNQANALNVSHSDLDSRKSALDAYLNGLSPSWNDATQNTSIDANTFRQRFTDYYTAKSALLTALSNAAAQAVPVVNLVSYSNFEAGTRGWAETYDPSGILPSITKGVFNGKPFLGALGSPTASGQFYSIGSTSGYFWPVTPGQRLFFGCGVKGQGAVSYQTGQMIFYDKGGANISQPTVWQTSGQSAYDTRIGGFVTVPANSIRASFQLFSFSGGSGSMDVNLTDPIVCVVPTGQTTWPVFVPGPSNDAGADVTGANTALDTTNVNGVAASQITSDISTAKQTAGDASKLATAAKAFSDDVADNSKFSKDEKKRYYQQITSWAGSGSGSVSSILNTLNTYGQSSAYSALSSAWNIFYAYLQQNHYSDLSSSDGINRSTFQAYERSFQDALQGAATALTNYANTLSIQTSANLFTDPTFSRLNSSADWSTVTLGAGSSAGDDYQGRRMQFNSNANSYLNTKPVPITQGDRVDAHFDLYVQNGWNSGQLRIKANWLDNSLTSQGTSDIVYVGGGTYGNGGWYLNIAGAVVCPVPCAYVQIYIEANIYNGTAFLRNPFATKVPKAVFNLDGNGRQQSALLTSVYAMAGGPQASGLSMSASGSTINISNFSVDFGDGFQSINGASIGGLSGSSGYYVWLLAPNMNNNGRSFGVSTSFTGNSDKQRIMLGYVNMLSGSTSGGTSTSGGNADRCVDEQSWLLDVLQAKDAITGTEIELLRRDWSGSEPGHITGIERAYVDCVMLTTKRGAELICSTTTPIELPDGTIIRAPEAAYATVASIVDGVFAPDDIVMTITPVGKRFVQQIHVGDRVYAAGRTSDARIFTHNGFAKP